MVSGGHQVSLQLVEHGVGYVPTIFASQLSEAAVIVGHQVSLQLVEHGVRYVPPIFASEL